MRGTKLFASIAMAALLSTGAAYSADKDTFVKATIGTVRTLDPAMVYDTEGGMRVRNIYETLVFFDGESTEKFIPLLAEEVPTVENGGISADGLTYTFKIRKGVKFHNGATLTPEDVAYSFERNMMVDQDGGPAWMLLEALTGSAGTRDGDGKIVPGIFEKIDKAVEVSGDKVILHLPKPYPPLMGILAFTASSIVNKKWSIENGTWDGVWANAEKFNNPPFNVEPLQNKAMGTGAYKLKSWQPSNQFVFERFDDYWGGAPDIKTAIVKYVPEWTTRKLMLQNGDADTVTVDNVYAPELEEMKNLDVYHVPQLSMAALLFNQKINTTGNTDIGSGKLDGNGIPPDFFSDIHVRRAFAHAIDYAAYKTDVGNDLIEIPSSPNVKGLPFHKEVKRNEFDMDAAERELRKAWGGKLWDIGFKMTMTHNTGNALREAAANMVAENLNSLNDKFQIEVRNVEWKDYLVKYRNYLYPVFIIGWGADYPDPHNFLYTYMHSNGVYGKYMNYVNPDVDALAEQGIAKVNPVEREKIYTDLQNLWYTEVPGIALYQQVLVKPYRKNVTGFVPNAMFADAYEMLKYLKKD